MAQFLTNFSENVLGTGTPSGWTLDTGTAVCVVAADATDPEFPRSLGFSSGTSSDLTFNAVGTNADQEVLGLMICPSITTLSLIIAFCRMQTGAISGYAASFNNSGGVNNFVLTSLSAGASTSIGSPVKSWLAGEAWWARLRCSGTTISAKFWKLGTAEPGAFDVTGANATWASGKSGLRVSSSLPKQLFWSVGTNGDVAPSRSVPTPKRIRNFIEKRQGFAY